MGTREEEMRINSDTGLSEGLRGLWPVELLWHEEKEEASKSKDLG